MFIYHPTLCLINNYKIGFKKGAFSLKIFPVFRCFSFFCKLNSDPPNSFGKTGWLNFPLSFSVFQPFKAFNILLVMNQKLSFCILMIVCTCYFFTTFHSYWRWKWELSSRCSDSFWKQKVFMTLHLIYGRHINGKWPHQRNNNSIMNLKIEQFILRLEDFMQSINFWLNFELKWRI